MIKYSANSFSSTMGPDGIHSKQFSENLTNGKGISSIVTNDNGFIQKKTEKIDLNKLLQKKSKRRRTERRLISRFITDPKEKKKWKALFKSRKNIK
jgi:hypothetical protein